MNLKLRLDTSFEDMLPKPEFHELLHLSMPHSTRMDLAKKTERATWHETYQYTLLYLGGQHA